MSTFIADGRRFKIGEHVTSVGSGIVWEVTGCLPDTYGVGRHRNLVTVRRPDQPGIENVFEAGDLR